MRNEPDTRRCYLCDETKPATTEHFPKDKNRYLGIGYQCRPCALRVRRERGDPRKGRWSKMTAKEKAKRMVTQKKHFASGGWRSSRVGAYRYYDAKKGMKCDLTAKWFEVNIQDKPCIYCKRSDVRIGCDRVDNSIGHTMANVVPSCGDCNKSRQDIFTHEEMLDLGQHIATIFANRERRTQSA